ncbi:hypothetical protein C1646_793679 [Rhizophagus diaphanus]|nr:hypothetical protein C1646_793679 [Rhizophagus diaphanus] [Rhizophagus sp. MUCL 43196]
MQAISSKISQSTSSSSFSPSKLANLKVKIPVICLPKSVANLPKLNRQPLDENERDLKVKNKKLKAHVEELEMQLNKISLKLKESQNLNETLIVINEKFRKENNDLYKKLEIYKHLRKPRIMEERKSTCKHAKSDKYESEYKERMSDIDADDSGMNEKAARMEMKSILKTIPRESDMKYDETFMSPANLEVQRKLVLELMKSLKPKFNPTHNQKIIRRLKAAKALFENNDTNMS